MVKNTNLEDVENVLLYSHEFVPSEKKKGLFLYQEKIKAEKEVISERPEVEAAQVPPTDPTKEVGEELPAIGTVGEIETPTVILEEKVGVEIPVEKKEAEAEEIIAEAPPLEIRAEKKSKEKEPKKKKRKLKAEAEKDPRRRRGERRLIEEKIEIEESELEALIAVKAKEKEEILEEKIPLAKEEEKRVAFKTAEPEEPLAGVFGEMLKSALGQKEGEKKPKAKPAPKKTKPKKEAKKKKSSTD